MAKSKFLKTVKEVLKDEPKKVEPDIIPDPIKIEEPKIEVETKELEPIIDKEPEEMTVIGTASAENLQKGGWTLIDAHLTPKGKEYKFRKVK